MRLPVSDNMSSRCWIFLAVLSALSVLATTHRGRGGFRPGGWSRGGSRGGSAHGTKEVCPGIYSAVCSSKPSAQPAGQGRKGKISSFIQILSCVDACKADEPCLVNATFGASGKKRRLPSLPSEQSCPLCVSGCPSGTNCVEDQSFCPSNPENVICKVIALQTSYNATLSRCLSDTAATTIQPTPPSSPGNSTTPPAAP